MKNVFAAALAVLAFGCASVMHGRYQQVPINSTPSGASITVDCGRGPQPAGVTPAAVSLKRNADPCKVGLSKEGYEPNSVVFAKSLSGAFWGNLVIGGIVGWIIDGVDGAMYNRVPDAVQVSLVPTK